MVFCCKFYISKFYASDRKLVEIILFKYEIQYLLNTEDRFKEIYVHVIYSQLNKPGFDQSLLGTSQILLPQITGSFSCDH